jgi:hypothetical protein
MPKKNSLKKQKRRMSFFTGVTCTIVVVNGGIIFKPLAAIKTVNTLLICNPINNSITINGH